MQIPSILATLPVFILAGCASGPTAEQQATMASGPTAEQQATMASDARKAAGALIQQLGGELKQVLSDKGLADAIGVCKERAPQIAAAVSKQSGFDVKRVSPKNRNPNGVPDAWETQAQTSLEKRLAAGEKPETLDTWQIVDTPSGKQFRYAKALPVQPLCLACHGEVLADEVKARIDAEYPNDRATGYQLGMLRGIVSIKRPL